MPTWCPGKPRPWVFLLINNKSNPVIDDFLAKDYAACKRKGMSRKLRKLVCKESKWGEMSEEERRPSYLLIREVGNPYTCVPGVY